MRTTWAALTTSLLLSLSVQSSAYAQTAMQKQLADQVDAACKRTIEVVLQAFRPHLNSYPDLRNKRNLVIYGPHHEFNAIAAYRDRQITITKGLCSHLWLLNGAIGFSYILPQTQPQVLDYTKYLNSFGSRLERLGPGYYEFEILPFPLKANIDLRRLSTSQSQMLERMVELGMKEAIGFIVAHEIGHLALNHQSAFGAASRAQEHSADDFAVDLTEKSGLSGFGSTASLLVFLQKEAVLKRSAANSHPRPECRMHRIFTRSRVINAMVRDRTRQAELQQRTGMSIAQYNQFMSALAGDCASRP